jgi:hypothetical protein
MLDMPDLQQESSESLPAETRLHECDTALAQEDVSNTGKYVAASVHTIASPNRSQSWLSIYSKFVYLIAKPNPSL